MLPRTAFRSLESVETIGHSTLPIDVFLDILRQNQCGILIDVRTVPRSRHNPQFEQGVLATSLASADIEYRWMRNLGGLRRPRKDSINFGWRNKSFRGYADYMQTTEFSAAIDELLAIPRPSSADASSPALVLMCAEAVPWRCHRSLIGDALLVRGVPVEDIFYDTKGKSHCKPHSLTSFACTEGNRLWYPPENDLFAAQSSRR